MAPAFIYYPFSFNLLTALGTKPQLELGQCRGCQGLFFGLKSMDWKGEWHKVSRDLGSVQVLQ